MKGGREMKKKELQEAAKELNEVLALEPEINVEGSVTELKEDIKGVIPLIEEDDELTTPTTNIIKALSEPKEEKRKEGARPETVKEEQRVAKGKDSVEEEQEKVSATTAICQMVCENFDIDKVTVKKKLEKLNIPCSEATISAQMRDTQKAIHFLAKLGKLK